MSYIKSNTFNLTYLVCPCCVKPGWIYSSQMKSGVKYRFILGLKKLVLKSISQTNTNKKGNKQTNKRTNKRKKYSNQAYTRVDLDDS